MTDLEMTELCAEAMGVPLMGSNVPLWNPLHDDAQAMALVKKFALDIVCAGQWQVSRSRRGDTTAVNADLNRAIVECVAKMKGST